MWHVASMLHGMSGLTCMSLMTCTHIANTLSRKFIEVLISLKKRQYYAPAILEHSYTGNITGSKYYVAHVAQNTTKKKTHHEPS